MKRVLCIWLPRWPIQRLVVARPELSHQPIILQAGRGNRGQRVAVCSCTAAAAGVRCGMPVAEATALLRQQQRRGRSQPRTSSPASRGREAARSTKWTILPWDPAADRQELERLAEWCEPFSPLVGLESAGDTARGESDEPECLLLDVTGLGPLFGGEHALAQRVASELGARGYTAHVAIADTVGAAWAVARFASVSSSAVSSSATVAVIAAGQAGAALAPLPLAALRLPPPAISVLEQLGVQQTGQLLSLPRASVATRLGDIVLRRIDQARGQLPELIAVHRAPATFQASWELEYPTDQRAAVEFVIQQLIQRIAHLLAEQNRGAVRLEIRLRCAKPGAEVTRPVAEAARRGAGEKKKKRKNSPNPHQSPCEKESGPAEVVLSLGLFRPTASDRHLIELARLQWERTNWPAAVQEVIVRVPLTAPLEARQIDLFDELACDGPRQMALLIDRLSSRLGRESVLQPRLLAEAQPERACRYLPLAGHSPRNKRTTRAETGRPTRRIFDRPLHLQHPPLPLQVEPQDAHDAPTRFHDQHRWHMIARTWGPERIETGWWRGPTVRRDYYRVETQSGHWFWIFRDLNSGRWFLQGMFD